MSTASIRSLASSLLLDLLKAYSPSKREKDAINILKEYAEELGYEEVIVDEVGNLIASYGKGDLKIAVIGHIDTIPWELPASFDGDRFLGRGAVDAKGPLAAAFIGLAFARGAVDTKKVKVYAIAVVDEEGDSLGARYLIKSGFKAHGIVVAEPSNTNGVVIGYRGSIKVKISCRGPGGHSSSGTMGSACERLIHLWQRVKGLYPDDGNNHVNICTPALLKLHCGEDAPVVPRYGEALISVRVAINSSVEAVKKELENIFNSFSGCEWELLDSVEPVKVSVNGVAVRALVRAMIKNGIRPRILYKHGTSDMNIFYSRATKHIVAYGPGRSELAHTDKEEITLEELVQGISIYRDFIREFTEIA